VIEEAEPDRGRGVDQVKSESARAALELARAQVLGRDPK